MREVRVALLEADVALPVIKTFIEAVKAKALGAEVILEGDHYAEAQRHCDKLRAENGLAFVHPFDDPLVIAGDGTVGMEVLRQAPGFVQ